MSDAFAKFFEQYGSLLLANTWITVYVTILATIFAYLLGIPVGVLSYITKPRGIWPHRLLYTVTEWIINIGRSIPFIILLFAVSPFTRFIVHTTIGPNAMIPPLVIAATPFVARMVESALLEVDAGVIEVAQSVGSTVWQIVWKVILPESKPSIVFGSSITFITLIGYVAMAGALGGGGLGDVAIRYGYYRYQSDVMIVTLIIIVALVVIVQQSGNILTRRMDKRIKK